MNKVCGLLFSETLKEVSLLFYFLNGAKDNPVSVVDLVASSTIGLLPL